MRQLDFKATKTLPVRYFELDLLKYQSVQLDSEKLSYPVPNKCLGLMMEQLKEKLQPG